MNRPVDTRLNLIVGADTSETIITEAIRGGVTFVQYRDKSSSTHDSVDRARSLVELLRPHDVPLVINDRVDIALAARCDGVHLGQDDMHPRDARELLGTEAIIGLTVHDQREIDAAPLTDLDYISIGGVYATMSKVNKTSPIGTEGLALLTKHARTRGARNVIAIAGIGIDNVAATLNCGIDGIAVISAITQADAPYQAAHQLRAAIEHRD